VITIDSIEHTPKGASSGRSANMLEMAW
jgi:hypothetical protein